MFSCLATKQSTTLRYTCRDPDLERRNSHAQASPSSSPSPRGPVDLRRMSQQVKLDLQAEEEERTKLRQARMQRADRAAAAANAAIKVGQTNNLFAQSFAMNCAVC